MEIHMKKVPSYDSFRTKQNEALLNIMLQKCLNSHHTNAVTTLPVTHIVLLSGHLELLHCSDNMITQKLSALMWPESRSAGMGP